MRAARVYRAGEKFKIEDIEKPRLEKDTAIIKVKAAGVCATELDFIEGIFPINPSPLVPGHEISGDIEEIDPAIRTEFKVGDKVVIYNVMNCGLCWYCRNDFENDCPNRAGQIGFTVNGGFEEYVKVPISSLTHLPSNVSYEEGAVLACSGMTAVHSSRRAGTKMGDIVAVNGIGGVGLMCIQIAKICGARVIGIADSEEKAELAKKAGADDTIIVSPPYDGYKKLGERIRKITNDKGLDIFYELVGTTNTLNAGVDSLGIGGRLMIIGYKAKQNLNFYPVDLLIKEGQILTSVAGCKRDLELSLQFANEKRANPIITNRIPLEKINDAIQLIIDRKIKGRSVIMMDMK